MTDSVTITVSVPVSFKRFTVPNHAIQERPARPRQEGTQSLPSTPLAQLDQAALDALADAWLEDLYVKAGKTSPFRKVAFRGS